MNMSNLIFADILDHKIHERRRIAINKNQTINMREASKLISDMGVDCLDIEELTFTGNPLSVAIVSPPTSSDYGLCYLDLTESFKDFLNNLVSYSLSLDYFGYRRKQSSLIINNSTAGYCRIALSWIEILQPPTNKLYVIEDYNNNTIKVTTSQNDPDFITARQSTHCTTYQVNLGSPSNKVSTSNSCDGSLNKIYYYTTDNSQELTINQPHIPSGFGYSFSTYEEEYHIILPPVIFSTYNQSYGYGYSYTVAWDIDVRTHAYFNQGSFGSFNGTTVITATAGSDIKNCSDVIRFTVSDVKLATSYNSSDSLEVSSFVAR